MGKKLVEGLIQFITHNKIKKDLWGRLILYKAVQANRAPYYHHFGQAFYPPVYQNGAEISCSLYNKSRFQDCGSGLHVATLEFALNFGKSSTQGQTVLEVAVWPNDVVCVPLSNEGKIRVKKLYVSRVIQHRDKDASSILYFNF